MSYQLSTLSNGLRVATRAMEGVESISFGLFVDVGARHETDANNGVSHFLEHMAFKGTFSRSAQDIAREFDAIGGHLNAYTSMEHTVYYAKSLREDFAKAADILTDIMLNSVFDPEEIDREREVILQEIAMHKDTPDDLVFDLFQQAIFPGQPMGRSILGSESNVRGFQRGDLIRYMEEGYAPASMIFSAAGNIRHDEIVAVAERTMGSLKAKEAKAPIPATYAGQDVRQQQKLEQLHLAIGFPGVSYTDPLYYAFQVFSAVLGGGMSSRLFQEVREKRGLAYSIGSYANSYPECGVFTIYSSTTEQHAVQLLQVVGEELAKAADDISEAELARAKSQIRAGIRMAMESTTNQFESLGRNLLCFGRQREPKEIAALIEQVSIADLKTLHGKLVDKNNLALAALGPVKALPDHDLVRALFEV